MAAESQLQSQSALFERLDVVLAEKQASEAQALTLERERKTLQEARPAAGARCADGTSAGRRRVGTGVPRSAGPVECVSAYRLRGACSDGLRWREWQEAAILRASASASSEKAVASLARASAADSKLTERVRVALSAAEACVETAECAACAPAPAWPLLGMRCVWLVPVGAPVPCRGCGCPLGTDPSDLRACCCRLTGRYGRRPASTRRRRPRWRRRRSLRSPSAPPRRRQRFSARRCCWTAWPSRAPGRRPRCETAVPPGHMCRCGCPAAAARCLSGKLFSKLCVCGDVQEVALTEMQQTVMALETEVLLLREAQKQAELAATNATARAAAAEAQART